jgi:hypothetical protein
MTDEQRFVFDLKGWLLLPAVLDDKEIGEISAHLNALANTPTALPLHERYPLAGPGQELVDHPAIVNILREIIGPDPFPECYGFRCESSFVVRRHHGEAGSEPPHTGPVMGPLAYRVLNGTIWSGLTRVIWELSGVELGLGGTAIMSGSHKCNFPLPESLRSRHIDTALFEHYTCPPGSVVIMSESCWHYGVEWRDPTHDRLAVLNCYNSYLSQVHRMNLPSAVVEQMPPRRRTAFRGVWHRAGTGRGGQPFNNSYSPDNHAI